MPLAYAAIGRANARKVPSRASPANAATFAFGLMACFVAASANAATDYRCTIGKRISAAAESPAVRTAQEKAHIGQHFTVERRTGIMAGALKNSFQEDPQIIDDGSDGHGYKVVATIKPGESDVYGSGIYALIIDESVGTPQKPFVFMENGVTYFGQCEHQ
jgi:hypothetical protein